MMPNTTLSRAYYALAIACILDVIAIAAGASIPDFYGRPVLLLSFAVVVFKNAAHNSHRLISLGMVAAALVEAMQMLGIGFAWIASATAVYYLAYSVAFALRGGKIKSKLEATGFAVYALYSIVMFLWLEPYGFLRMASILYTAVVILFGGLSSRPVFARKEGAAWSRLLAGAVALLVISDSMWAISIFKEPVSEALILAPYWAGQFGLALWPIFDKKKQL